MPLGTRSWPVLNARRPILLYRVSQISRTGRQPTKARSLLWILVGVGGASWYCLLPAWKVRRSGRSVLPHAMPEINPALFFGDSSVTNQRRSHSRPTLRAIPVLALLAWAPGAWSQATPIARAAHFRGPTLIKTQGTSEADNVHCGLQDRAGNLWFGTTGEGVYRYDGKSFTNFTTKDALNSNTVWSILEDRAGDIWFGTAAGVCRYDGKTFTRIPISVTNGSSLYPAENSAWSIMQDKSGMFWFSTNDDVYCYNGKSSTRFLDNDNIINENGLGLRRVEDILEDKNGNIWFASWDNEGICRFDGKSLTNFKPNGDASFRRILEDKNGNLWFANRPTSVYRYDGKTFTNFTEKEKGLGGVNCFLVDKNGNIWFATGGNGVYRYDGRSFSTLTTKDGLGNNDVWCIVEDRAENIWVGTRNTGLYRYDGKSFTDFSEIESRR